MPLGPAFQRKSLSEDKIVFKKVYIKIFLKAHYVEGDQVLFFGDNAELDPQIYDEVIHELGLTNAKIFIRDIRAINTKYSPKGALTGRAGVNYFFSEVDLLKLPNKGQGLY